jgi:hypothetical protein
MVKRALHVLRVGRILGELLPQEREDVIAHELVDGVRVAERSEVLSPAEVLVENTFVVLAFWKKPARDRLLFRGCLPFFRVLQLIQPLDEQQIRELLDDLDGVGNAARPERIPDLVDLVSNLACQHRLLAE